MVESTDFYVDKELIKKALDNFPENKVTVLNQKTGSFFYDPWVIKPEYEKTIWKDILNILPYEKGESRLIILEPGETYMAHADIDDRWHLNLSGSYCYLIDLDNNKMYETRNDGMFYSMDASKIHVASNFGSTDRLQLVIRKLLKKSEKHDLVNISIRPNSDRYDYRYEFDRVWSPWLNLQSKKGFISDFSFDDKIVSFKMSKILLKDLEDNSNNNFFINHG